MKLEELFYYDITSPSGLRYKMDVYSGKGYNIKIVSAGDAAGSLKPDGYYTVSAYGIAIPAHRAVWKLHFGEIPSGLVIDHIDGCKSNNYIENLRVVTIKQNLQNQGMSRNNVSGHSGVNVETDICGGLVARARWSYLDGRRGSKSFSVNKYGYEAAKQMAIDYRAKMITELNAQGACYTERHGKPKEEANVNTSNS